MSQDIISGTAATAAKQYGWTLPTAAKTGTTESNQSSSFMGFNSNFAAVPYIYNDGTTTADLLGALQGDYADEHFVTVLPEGVFPTTGEVTGANTLRIGAAVDRHSGQATVISALDNLVKGTAGAAIQSMNLALGLPEGTGLTRTALAP